MKLVGTWVPCKHAGTARTRPMLPNSMFTGYLGSALYKCIDPYFCKFYRIYTPLSTKITEDIPKFSILTIINLYLGVSAEVRPFLCHKDLDRNGNLSVRGCSNTLLRYL